MMGLRWRAVWTALGLLIPALLPGEQVPLDWVTPAHKGQEVTLVGRVANYMEPISPAAPHRIFLTDESGSARIEVQGDAATSLKRYPKGQILTITGTIEAVSFNSLLRVTKAGAVQEGGTPVSKRSAAVETPRGADIQRTPIPQPDRAASTPAPASAAEPEPGIDWAAVTPTPHAGYVPPPLASVVRSNPDGPTYDLSAELTGFPDPLPIESLTPEMMDQVVTVEGEILSVGPSRGDRVPTTLVVRDEPELAVVYYPQVGKVIENGLGTPKAGQRVSARGVVSQYREQLQVKVTGASDILLQGSGRSLETIKEEWAAGLAPEVRDAIAAASSDPAVVPVREISKHLNERVILVGIVQDVRDPWSDRAPYILSLKGVTGEADIVFWSDFHDAIDPGLLEKGKAVALAGDVQEHRGAMQVRLASAEALGRLEPSGASTLIQALAAITPAPTQAPAEGE